VYVINGIAVNAQLVGKLFLQQVFKQVRSQNIEVTSLIFTAPVQAYERYLRWLESCSPELMNASDFDGDIRIIDEPTAAALGYAIAEPNSLILVIDFGGGTLDLCLIRTPKAKNLNEWGVVIVDRYLCRSEDAQSEDTLILSPDLKAKQVEVIAKTGQALGGADIDRWLLEHYIENENLIELGSNRILLKLMEQIKVDLSSQEIAKSVFYNPENIRAYNISYSRSQLEQILKDKGFYRVLQTAIDDVVNRAVAKGILRMDLKHIVLVGGSSLIPSVQNLIKNALPSAIIHGGRPLEAVI
jgi:molecular chaperone DnaK (HSP70)